MVKNLPAMQETQVQSLGWEDPLDDGMATHSSIFAWIIPTEEEHATVHGVTESRQDWVTKAHQKLQRNIKSPRFLRSEILPVLAIKYIWKILSGKVF